MKKTPKTGFNPKVLTFTRHALERFKERFGVDDPVVLRRLLKKSLPLYGNRRYVDGVIFIVDGHAVITAYPPTEKHTFRIEQAIDFDRMKKARKKGTR